MSTTTHSMTAEELIKLPRGNCRYELVKGELLTMSPAGARHGAVIINLTLPLAHHVKTHNLGVVFGAETGFTVERNPDTELAPDIAFVRARIAKLGEGYWEGAPDLAVEVVSPSDSKSKIEKNVRCWLEGGASAVLDCQPEKSHRVRSSDECRGNALM